MIPADDVEAHLVMCLTKPRVSYNGKYPGNASPVRSVIVSAQHVAKSDIWLSVNGSPPCWWWVCQSAVCCNC